MENKFYFYHYVNDAFLQNPRFANKYIVKIGYTKDPKQRLNQYLTCSPIRGRYDILYQVNFTDSAEALNYEYNFHQIMNSYRINYYNNNFLSGGNEWFIFENKEECQFYFKKLLIEHYVDFIETFYDNNIDDNICINPSPIIIQEKIIIDRDFIQSEILHKMIIHYSNYNKGILNLPTGYGKTNIALKYCVRQQYSKICVFVPRLSLLSQFHRSVRSFYPNKLIYVISCDNTAIKDENTIQFESKDTEDIIFNQNIHDYIVICVYNSSKKLIGKQFDLIIYDEAHHLVSPNNNDEKTYYTFGLYDKNIVSRHRLFLTATCKFIEIRKQIDSGYQSDSSNSELIDKCTYSMDNEDLYGKIIEKVSLRKAIEQDICCNYEVLLYSEYIDMEVSDFLTPGGIDSPNTRNTKIKQRKLENKYKIAAKNLYTAIHEYNKNKIVLYFAKIENCKLFIQLFKKQLLHKNEIWIDIVSSTDGRNMRQREDFYNEFSSNIQKSIICNVDIMTEGVDIPNIDMIGFMDKCNSGIKIIQIIGRMLRKCGDKIGHIFIPDVVYKNEVGVGCYKKLRVLIRSLANIDYNLFVYQLIKNKCEQTFNHKEIVKKHNFDEFMWEELSNHLNELHSKESDTFSYYPYNECLEIVRKQEWTTIDEWNKRELFIKDNRIPYKPCKIYESDGCYDMYIFLGVEKDISKQYKQILYEMFNEFFKSNSNPSYNELVDCIASNPVLYNYYIMENQLKTQNISYYQMTNAVSKFPTRNQLELEVKKIIKKEKLSYEIKKQKLKEKLEYEYYDKVLKLYPHYPKIFEMIY